MIVVQLNSFSPYKAKLFDFADSKMMNDPTLGDGEWCTHASKLRWQVDIEYHPIGLIVQPPEVCKRRHDKTVKILHPTKVDLFSFGMVSEFIYLTHTMEVLWELTTAMVPYNELSESYYVARAIIDGQRPKINEDTPTQVIIIIQYCIPYPH